MSDVYVNLYVIHVMRIALWSKHKRSSPIDLQETVATIAQTVNKLWSSLQ